ncbi:unnamed protein product [Adineta steineri]|uniref:Barrier to autointegration factor n=1 Tax=Adineta steineri TaxID=433720 RepID=A0A814FA93_9BILA|nr:unnamed protein product [Adineta steineri]CAF0983072.1 unnamed protein product [Adineta steineri]
MNEKRIYHIPSYSSSQRFFVRKENIINSIPFSSTTEKSNISSNQNCCKPEEKKISLPSIKAKQQSNAKDNFISAQDESIIEIPKQTKTVEIDSNEKLPLYCEVISNAWPVSNTRIENLNISFKRCQFSNEAISIKPITAVPGIGKKYGQLLADHGFIYARQLLGYYMMLKDNEMFRKWLEYKFHIPRFRAAEITSALNELIRRTL